MSVASTFVTLQQYLDRYLGGEQNFELDEGELVPVSPTAYKHARRLDKILRYLMQELPEEQYDILTGEPGFILSRDPKPTVRGADIAVLHYHDEIPDGLSTEPPLLVVEIVSPTNEPEDIEKKRIQYLEFGVKEIWVVYDRTKTIHVFLSAGSKSFVCAEDGVFNCSLGFPVIARRLFR